MLRNKPLSDLRRYLWMLSLVFAGPAWPLAGYTRAADCDGALPSPPQIALHQDTFRTVFSGTKKARTADFIVAVPRFGLQAVCLSGAILEQEFNGRSEEAIDQALDIIRKQAEEHNVAIARIDVPPSNLQEDLSKWVKWARRLGCASISVGIQGGVPNTTFKRYEESVVRAITELARIAAERGDDDNQQVSVLLRNGEGLSSDALWLNAIVNAVRKDPQMHGCVGVCLDTNSLGYSPRNAVWQVSARNDKGARVFSRDQTVNRDTRQAPDSTTNEQQEDQEGRPQQPPRNPASAGSDASVSSENTEPGTDPSPTTQNESESDSNSDAPGSDQPQPGSRDSADAVEDSPKNTSGEGESESEPQENASEPNEGARESAGRRPSQAGGRTTSQPAETDQILFAITLSFTGFDEAGDDVNYRYGDFFSGGFLKDAGFTSGNLTILFPRGAASKAEITKAKQLLESFVGRDSAPN